MTQALSGRHALVTGGSRGIGAAIARALSAAGARVTLLGRNADALDEAAITLERNAVTVTADVTDPAQVERAFAEAREAAGEISILVNNAGIGC
jgi:NAD(P)-dependent dehydrogenase (short-subunit alcohol dehydrogenase family)